MTDLVTVGFLHPGTFSACFANSLIDLLMFDMANKRRIVGNPHGYAGKETGAAHIHTGRNRLCKMVLDDSSSEWLFMVDADMGFAPDTVERLIASADPTSRPVVGGLAFAQKSDGNGEHYARRYRPTPTLYRAGEDDEAIGFAPMFDYPRDSLVEVDATGAACLLIHRGVLAKMREAHGDHWFHPVEIGTTEFGEDMSFCLRLASIDVPLFVDTSVKTTHDKGGVFFDEATFDQYQRLHAEEVTS